MFDEDKHIGQIIFECLQEKPESICQVDAATGEEETNASALRRSIRLALCFRRLNLVPGDVLALCGKNHIDQQIPNIAALMNGLPVTGIDPSYKIDEIKEIFKVTEPKIVFCEPESYNEYIKAAQDLGLDTKVYKYGKGDNSMQALVESSNDESLIEEYEPAIFDKDKIFALLVSSGGTTGVVKVAAIKHDALKHKMTSMLAGILKAADRKSLPYKPALNLSSIQWISGMMHTVSFPLLHQTKVQTSAPPTVEHVIDIINKYKPVSAILGPSLAYGILKSDTPCDLTCFDTIILTGGKIFKDLYLGMKERLNSKTLLIEMYGQTENLGPVFAPNPRGPIGNCGVPYLIVKTKLVDPDTGKEITDSNVTGELWTKGDGFTCYYNNPEETSNAFTEDGWFKTGDLLYRDENNNFFFVERLKMLIKYKNHQIIPPELETLIMTHKGVHEVSVTSIPHKEDGEHPVACIVRAPGSTVTAQEIKELVASKLSDMKQLRGGVVFLDQLPLTHAGKVARAKLRNLVQNMRRE